MEKEKDSVNGFGRQMASVARKRVTTKANISIHIHLNDGYIVTGGWDLCNSA